MKKIQLYFFSFLTLLVIFSSLPIIFNAVFAAAPVTCQDSGQACGTGTGNCCASSSNGKPLWCRPSRSGGAGTCTEDTAGVTCQKENSPCALNQRCCSVNDTGQGLTCDATTNTCKTASASTKTCLAENSSCTITDQCCSTTTKPLSCVDGSGNPIFTGTGSCKAATNTNAAQAYVSITPPPPPCAITVSPNATTTAGTGGCTGVNTAFGLWSTDPAGFVKSLFSVLMSIAGGVAMLIIIFAGYTMIASQGDPEKIQGAREQITAAVIGLLFLIFSVVVLEVIGVDILHLPGFTH